MVVNVTKTDVEVAYINVTLQNHKVKLGAYDFDPLTFALEPRMMSSDGLVVGDPIEEFILNVRGSSTLFAGRTSSSTGTICNTLVQRIPLEEMPFSLGKIWEGLVDIRVNLIIDGEEYEERAHLLFGADLQSNSL